MRSLVRRIHFGRERLAPRAQLLRWLSGERGDCFPPSFPANPPLATCSSHAPRVRAASSAPAYTTANMYFSLCQRKGGPSQSGMVRRIRCGSMGADALVSLKQRVPVWAPRAHPPAQQHKQGGDSTGISGEKRDHRHADGTREGGRGRGRDVHMDGSTSVHITYPCEAANHPAIGGKEQQEKNRANRGNTGWRHVCVCVCACAMCGGVGPDVRDTGGLATDMQYPPWG
mmetsp:Transcript_70875/g.118698  ORF Transcript_70875/g.118698 Transcript_70875/m.118698 type:complete len:228 (+) Transcript_70875:752-1435(+)